MCVSGFVFQQNPHSSGLLAAGETVSIALRGKMAGLDAVTSEADFGWWTHNDGALIRRAFNTKGEHCFTPLFSLHQKVARSLLSRLIGRGEDEAECSEEHV